MSLLLSSILFPTQSNLAFSPTTLQNRCVTVTVNLHCSRPSCLGPVPPASDPLVAAPCSREPCSPRCSPAPTSPPCSTGALLPSQTLCSRHGAGTSFLLCTQGTSGIKSTPLAATPRAPGWGSQLSCDAATGGSENISEQQVPSWTFSSPFKTRSPVVVPVSGNGDSVLHLVLPGSFESSWLPLLSDPLPARHRSRGSAVRTSGPSASLEGTHPLALPACACGPSPRPGPHAVNTVSSGASRN